MSTQQEASKNDHNGAGKDKHLSVTVRTPAGASHQFTFGRKERVDKVIREAVCKDTGDADSRLTLRAVVCPDYLDLA